ncbi:MAG: FAD-binding oxidoreductase, partial [Candidatus Omnitrophica bacterium]|nr:FAD-binding oxidoreductase [Candidatus Omnitrophota bacterium]
MPQIDAEIISNAKISKAYYLLRTEVDYAFKDAQPGQFVHVKVGEPGEPLLRRPFSIHALSPAKSKSSSKKCTLDILYEVKGKGTQLLTGKKQGELLNILGPLGRGFDYAPNNKADKLNILIAGGMGVAPLSFLSQKLTAAKKLVLIGSAT